MHQALGRHISITILISSLLAITCYYQPPISAYINLPVLAIMLSIIFISCCAYQQPREIFCLLKNLSLLFKPEKNNHYSEINQALRIAEHYRYFRIREAEYELSFICNNFLRLGLQQVIDGKKRPAIMSMLATHKASANKQFEYYLSTLKLVSTLTLAASIFTAIAGVIYIAQHNDNQTAQLSNQLVNLGLIPLLYGQIIVSFVLKPLALKLDTLRTQQATHFHMLEQTILLIQQRKHPIIIKDTLDAFFSAGTYQTIDAQLLEETNEDRTSITLLKS